MRDFKELQENWDKLNLFEMEYAILVDLVLTAQTRACISLSIYQELLSRGTSRKAGFHSVMIILHNALRVIFQLQDP